MTPVVLGRIAEVFGVKGWVKVISHTEPREAILEYRNWFLKRGDTWQARVVEDGKLRGRSLIAKLEGVDDRDAAIELMKADIAVSRDAMPETKAGEYYWADLEGLKVIHRNGMALGQVNYLMATGANDVLVVSGDQERLIPFVMDEVILDVDLVKGVISVDWEWD
ncbi:MAG: ribosome maturation factor RimM [Woeseia sp.]